MKVSFNISKEEFNHFKKEFLQSDDFVLGQKDYFNLVKEKKSEENKFGYFFVIESRSGLIGDIINFIISSPKFDKTKNRGILFYGSL
jgi:hypothetical protein